MRVIFVADTHLSEANPRKTGLFTDFLSTQARSVDQLYLLGDIFEYWLGPRHLELSEHGATLSKLKELVERGVEVFFLGGNRDFLFDSRTARRFGIRVLGVPGVIVLGGRRFYLTHGEELMSVSCRHSIYRLVVRNPLSLALLRKLPCWCSKPLAESFRKLSAGRRKYATSQPSPRQLMRASSRGVDEIICGHFHRPLQFTLPSGTRATVLGSWEESGWFALWEEGELRQVRFPPPSSSE